MCAIASRRSASCLCRALPLRYVCTMPYTPTASTNVTRLCVRACVCVWYVLQRYPTVRLNVALDDVPIALREDKMAQQVLP